MKGCSREGRPVHNPGTAVGGVPRWNSAGFPSTIQASITQPHGQPMAARQTDAELPRAASLNEKPELAVDGASITPLDRVLRAESVAFAYILGSWAAHSRVGTTTDRRLAFACEQRSALVPLQRAWRDFLGTVPRIEKVHIGEAPSFRMTIFSERLSHYVHAVTDNNASIPWEHLGTREEQRAFLRGLFHHRGWVSTGKSPCLGIHKQDGYPLLQGTAALLFRFDIYPLVSNGPTASLRLKERAEWLKFREQVGYVRAADRATLSRLCRMRGTKRSFTVEEYEEVMDRGVRGNQAPPVIARATGVPENSVRDWLYREQVPRIVVRYQQAKETASSFPDPGTAAYLFRELNVTSATARLVATHWEAAALQQRLAAECSPTQSPEGNSELLLRLVSERTRNGRASPHNDSHRAH